MESIMKKLDSMQSDIRGFAGQEEHVSGGNGKGKERAL